MKKIPIFEGEVTDEVNLPVSRILGQLVISHGVPYIVVETRENETYQEDSGTHHKIGGFVKIKPDRIRYLNPEIHRMEDFKLG